MPFLTLSIDATALSTTRQWQFESIKIKPIKKNHGLFFFDAYLRLELFNQLSPPVEITGTTVFRLRCYSDEQNSDLSFSDDRLVCDCMPGEQWSTSYYAFQRSGSWRQNILRDKYFVGDSLTLGWDLKKPSSQYHTKAFLRLYYEEVKISRSEWLAAYRR